MTPDQIAELTMFKYLRAKAKKGAVAFADTDNTPTGQPLVIYRELDDFSPGKRWLYGAICGRFHFSAKGAWLVDKVQQDHPTEAQLKELRETYDVFTCTGKYIA